MTRLIMVRHGPTAWAEEGRIQGRTDIPLSAEGRVAVGAWRLPPETEGAAWYTSPLRRAKETAELLGGAARPETRLIEMDWGACEGRTLDDLRANEPSFKEMEERGLDFRPRGGETPREVQARMRPWLVEIAVAATVVAVSHRGVIRALFALATGWPMLGKPPAKLDWRSAHVFNLAGDGTPSVARLNLPLDPA
ncbi:MAG: histidine phosphatase family protein [Alphaproteobacteria bacterium]|nr:histidine phosphatase family protein [Alphaproteobacteria bacterium]